MVQISIKIYKGLEFLVPNCDSKVQVGELDQPLYVTAIKTRVDVLMREQTTKRRYLSHV
jgi:hypothetical protein